MFSTEKIKAAKIEVGTALAGLVVVSLLILQASTAAFTDTTENAGNNWEAGAVTLTDDAGGALFSTANDGVLAPGDIVADKCLDVTYNGNLTPSAAVKLYVSALTDTPGGGSGDGLSDDLNVTVQIGAATESCESATKTWTQVYSGTLAAMGTDFATGSATWTPAPGTARPFNFTVTLNSAAANDAQADTTTATFTWEVQS